MNYWLISSATDSPLNLTEACFLDALNAWMCGECHCVLKSVVAPTIQVMNPTIDSAALSFDRTSGLSVISSSLLDALQISSLRASVTVGAVFLPDGNRSENFVTLVGADKLILRGTVDADCRVCARCHRNIYFALPPKYIYPQPESNLDFYDCRAGRILVSEKAYSRIAEQEWLKVHIDRIPIVSTPSDQFGNLPYWSEVTPIFWTGAK